MNKWIMSHESIVSYIVCPPLYTRLIYNKKWPMTWHKSFLYPNSFYIYFFLLQPSVRILRSRKGSSSYERNNKQSVKTMDVKDLRGRTQQTRELKAYDVLPNETKDSLPNVMLLTKHKCSGRERSIRYTCKHFYGEMYTLFLRRWQ